MVRIYATSVRDRLRVRLRVRLRLRLRVRLRVRVEGTDFCLTRGSS